MFLIPFSIPGIGGVVKAISKTPTQEIVRYSEPAIDVLKKGSGIVLGNLGQRTPKAIDAVGNVAKEYPISVRIPGSGHTVKFKNLLEEGRLGDDLTAAYLRNDGYEELPSKLPGGQGIDGVYIKSSFLSKLMGKPPKIRIIENKVGKSALLPGQMTKGWIINKIQKMKEYEHLKSTAILLEKNLSSASLELWRHDLSKSRSSVSVLNSKAEVKSTEYLPGKFIPESITRMCKSESKSFACILSR